MKWRLSLLIILVLACEIDLNACVLFTANALRDDVVSVDNDGIKQEVKTGNNSSIPKIKDDTVKVVTGTNPRLTVKGKQTSTPENTNPQQNSNENFSPDRIPFKGHYSIFEIGVNSFSKTNYSGYTITDFMDLNQNKSYEFNINIYRYSIGLQKVKNTIGLVTGLGLNFNDYHFSNPYTIVNDGGHVMPSLLDSNGLSKTKLSTTYLTVPLFIEFQVPVSGQYNRIYFSGGIIGGIKLGSHTKVKHYSLKEKVHEDFNVNPFRYGATVRIGYKDINIFGTYYNTTFFKQDRGPEMYPFTIGIGIITR